MNRVENHILREENLSNLRKYETKNVAFDILSRAAFIIDTSKLQPTMTMTDHGTIICVYPYFSVEIKSSENVIRHINGNEETYTDNKLITRIRDLLKFY